jgi:hypothetical protein
MQYLRISEHMYYDTVKTVVLWLAILFLGFSTDGEFNSLRTMGSNRPISVIQLLMNAKAKARSMSVKVIEKCLQPVKGLLEILWSIVS